MTVTIKNEILWQQWIQPSAAPSAAEYRIPSGTEYNIAVTSASTPSTPATEEEVGAIAARLLKKNAELYRRLAK